MGRRSTGSKTTLGISRGIVGGRRRKNKGLIVGTQPNASSLVTTEAEIQQAYWDYLNKIPVRIQTGGTISFPLVELYKLGDFAYHVPNGIWIPGDPKASAIIINSLRSKGWRNGVSDIVIAYPTKRWHCAYIELKRDKNSKVSDEQRDWLKIMRRVGNYADIVTGLDQAIVTTQRFMGDLDPLYVEET